MDLTIKRQCEALVPAIAFTWALAMMAVAAPAYCTMALALTTAFAVVLLAPFGRIILGTVGTRLVDDQLKLKRLRPWLLTVAGAGVGVATVLWPVA